MARTRFRLGSRAEKQPFAYVCAGSQYGRELARLRVDWKCGRRTRFKVSARRESGRWLLYILSGAHPKLLYIAFKLSVNVFNPGTSIEWIYFIGDSVCSNASCRSFRHARPKPREMEQIGRDMTQFSASTVVAARS